MTMTTNRLYTDQTLLHDVIIYNDISQAVLTVTGMCDF